MSGKPVEHRPEKDGPPIPIKVVICWHMHQPQYANLLKGEYQLPWTYLHAIKDYTDMAAHLEAEPAAKAVVNFAPILLEQLQDYGEQIRAFLNTLIHPRPSIPRRFCRWKWKIVCASSKIVSRPIGTE